jgi:hypothetical protein
MIANVYGSVIRERTETSWVWCVLRSSIECHRQQALDIGGLIEFPGQKHHVNTMLERPRQRVQGLAELHKSSYLRSQSEVRNPWTLTEQRAESAHQVAHQVEMSLAQTTNSTAPLVALAQRLLDQAIQTELSRCAPCTTRTR